MNRSPVLLPSIVALLLCVSCVNTSLTSMKSPQFSGKKYTRVAVFALFADLALIQSAEKKACDAIERAGGKAIAGSSLALPGTAFSDAALATRLRDSQIDGILTIGISGEGTTANYVPPAYHTTATTHGTAYSSGGTIYGQATTNATTRTTGGYYVHKPWATFELVLFDFAAGEKAWIASGRSNGGAGVSSWELVSSLVDATVARLIAEDVLVLTPTSQAEAMPQKAVVQ